MIKYGNPAEDILSSPVEPLVTKDISTMTITNSVAEVTNFMVINAFHKEI